MGVVLAHETLVRIIRDLDTYRVIHLDVLTAYSISVELVYRDMIAYQIMERSDQIMDEGCELVRSILYMIKSMKEDKEHSSRFNVYDILPLVVQGGCGRPLVLSRYNIFYRESIHFRE